MSDQLNALDDVQRSLDLLEILIDPIVISGKVLHHMTTSSWVPCCAT